MVSRLIRRTHMYLALFLFPWMLMYAISTLAMTHRAWFGAQSAFEVERRITFDAAFRPDAEPRLVSAQILASLGLDGAHTVTRRKDGAYVINRTDLLMPRRLTYSPGDQSLVIERLPFSTYGWLARFHRRRGYTTGYALDTTWAVTVDAVIAAMIVWGLSGLWMWWEMRATRGWGLASAIGGAALFGFFLSAL